MPHSLHDIDAALDAHELAEMARAGDPRLLDRACARRMGGAGIRRGLRGPGRHRIEYLWGLDWGLFADFARAGEAAAQDPRDGWAWYDTVTPYPGTDVKRILRDGTAFIEGAGTNQNDLKSGDLTGWADVGTPGIVLSAGPSGVADSASRLTDNDGAANEGKSNAITVTSGTAQALSFDVLKDDDETRFPGVTAVHGAVTEAVMVNSKTGETTTWGGNAFDNVATEDMGDRWRITADFDATNVTVIATLYPSIATAWGTLSTAAQGSATFSGFQLEPGGLTTPVAPSSNIRTPTGVATRQPDLMDLDSIPAGLAAKIESAAGFWFEWSPEFASTDVTANNPRIFDVDNGDFQLIRDGAAGHTFAVNIGPNQVTLPTADYSRADRLRSWLSFPSGGDGTLKVWNLTQGLGPFTGTKVGLPAYTTATKKLRLGGRSTAATAHAPGVYSRWAAGHP